jgi:ElaB/YqjD/DUF883 family membrane-anchored ribosome-binding protein
MSIASHLHKNTDKTPNADGNKSSETTAMVTSEFHKFLADIEDLIKETNLLNGDELAKAKAEINNRIHTAKVAIGDASNTVAKQAKDTATNTNAYVHEQPWQVIGAIGVAGFLLGYMLSRPSK